MCLLISEAVVVVDRLVLTGFEAGQDWGNRSAGADARPAILGALSSEREASQ
jgi:hypothetical protein